MAGKIRWLKPVLVGETNPYSADLRDALAPYPRGSTGEKIYKLLRSRVDLTPDQYMKAFHRVNFQDAGLESSELVRTLPMQSTVILFGRRSLDFIRQSVDLPICLLHPQSMSGRTWRQFPHPSGLNRFYNDPTMREILAILLEDLYRETAPWMRTD